MSKLLFHSGDKVWQRISADVVTIEQKTIDGWRAYGIFYTDGTWTHYCRGLFYAFGYHNDGFMIITKKRWHLYPAVICEKIRLSLPKWLSKFLKLEA